MARNGRSSHQPGHISNIIADLEVGDGVEIVVERNGRQTFTGKVVGVNSATMTLTARYEVYEVNLENNMGARRQIYTFSVPTRGGATINVAKRDDHFYNLDYVEVTG